MLSISENILLVVSGFGMLQGVLLALLIYFHPKTDRSVSSYLALYILFVSMPIMITVGQHLFYWQFIFFVEPIILLIGPFLYLYIKSFKESISFRKAWPHFILFGLYAILAVWQYNHFGKQYPQTVTVPPEVVKEPVIVTEVIIRTIQRLVYYFISLRTLKSYQRSIRQLFSETSRINLRWVRWLINGNLVLIIMTFLFYMMLLRFPDQFNLWVLIITTIVSIYIYLATFKGVTQPSLWQVIPGIAKKQLEADMQKAEEIELLHSGKGNRETERPVMNSRSAAIVSRVIELMEVEKYYQEPELTLQDLADKLQVPSYQVSQAINEGLKKNFYDLINGYRIEEAKRLLLDPVNSNYTILSVGFEAGFNSKTTFNTVFKKFTGHTPTEFRGRWMTGQKEE
jgi:AraC-like DNA-binding protein